jgi:hypothetical protein
MTAPRFGRNLGRAAQGAVAADFAILCSTGDRSGSVASRPCYNLSMYAAFCRIIVTIFTFALLEASMAATTDSEDLLRFLEGRYRLVGKEANANRTFLGEVLIKRKGKTLEITRLINGTRTRGTGSIDLATADRIKVLRARYQGGLEGNYLFGSDLDNYARITGYIYRVGQRTTRNPGLEALFADAVLSR